MDDRDALSRIHELGSELERIRREVAELRRRVEPEAVEDYRLAGPDGPVALSELFDGRDDLLLVHNMGRACRYCTMWADGLSGLHPHLTDRAAFALVSPDPPEVQAALAADRGWPFRMVSDPEGRFSRELGFEEDGGRLPGVSAFHREADGRIVRTGQDAFGPGDAYNPAWHLFDLLRDGAAGWAPRDAYGPDEGA